MSPIRKVNGQNWLPSLFNDFFPDDWMGRMNATAPAVNVIETDMEYKVEVAAPGMKKEDFSIHLNDNNELVVIMEKKNESKEEDKKNKKFLRREFSYAKYQHSLLLPDNVNKEHIEATVNDGVLTITLPKMKASEKEKENRKIEIK